MAQDNCKKASSDVLMIRDEPKPGYCSYCRFTPLTEDGRHVLTTFAQAERLVEIGSAFWDESSLCVNADVGEADDDVVVDDEDEENVGSEADLVYQTLLIAGLQVEFETGDTKWVSPELRAAWYKSLPEDVRQYVVRTQLMFAK